MAPYSPAFLKAKRALSRKKKGNHAGSNPKDGPAITEMDRPNLPRVAKPHPSLHPDPDIVELTSDGHEVPPERGRSSREPVPPDPDIIEISESSAYEETPEELANLPLQPGDSEYKGARSKRSRVHPSGPEQHGSPPITRRRARMIESGEIDAPPVVEAPLSRPTPRPRPKRKAPPPEEPEWLKKAKLTTFRDPELTPHPASPRAIKPLPPLFPTPSPVPTDNSTEFPHASVVLRKWGEEDKIKKALARIKAEKAKIRVEKAKLRALQAKANKRLSFVDKEAEDDVELNPFPSDDSDRYDSEDSFIDDSPERAESVKSDEPEFSNGVPEVNSDDAQEVASEGAADDHQFEDLWEGIASPPLRAPETPKTPKKSVAPRRDVLRTYGLFTPSTPSRTRASKPSTPATPKVPKGKAKAVVYSEDENDDLIIKTDEELLSEEEREYRVALRLSKEEVTSKPGQSSSTQGSTSSKPTPSSKLLAKDELIPSSSQNNIPIMPLTPQTPSLQSSSNQSWSTPTGSGPLPKIPAHLDPLAQSSFTSITPTTPTPTAPTPPTDPTISHHVLALQNPCQINQERLQDPLLKEDYTDTPPLAACQILAFSEYPIHGHPAFTRWLTGMEGINMESAYNAVRFVEVPNGPYVNPCRASPVRVDCKEASSNRKYKLMRNGGPLIAVVSGYLESSQLTHFGNGGMKNHNVRVNLHGQESPRYGSYNCMTFGRNPLYHHLWNDAYQFSTRSAPKETSNRRGFGGSSNGASTSDGQYSDPFTLSHSEEVPVYDARGGRTIDFNTDLPHLSTLFPRFQGEIPHESLVVVGHTLSTYITSTGNYANKWTLGCNLLWVIVLGTPAPTG